MEPAPVQASNEPFMSPSLKISESELEKGSKASRNKDLGAGKYAFIIVGFFIGVFIKLGLFFIAKIITGITIIYAAFSILAFLVLLSIGKEYPELHYLAVGLMIAIFI
jgi:hypothetical protein